MKESSLHCETISTKQEVIDIIKANLSNFASFGVAEVGLFGSFAVDRARADSDLDFLVEFEGVTTFDRYMDLKFFLEDLFEVSVDLVTERSLKPEIAPEVLHKAIYVMQP